MRAIFLSDAHLRQPQDKNYQILLDFLNRQEDLDALFLLGDIFEFWIGYRHVTFSAYVPLLEKLRQLSMRGTQLFFVEGNHDFHLGPYFSETLHCTVIPDQQIVEWDSARLLICHGDLLNPEPGYQRLRSLWRSRLARALSRILHPDLVWGFAMQLCDRSAKKRPQRSHIDPAPFLKTYASNRTDDRLDAILCGHYHHPVDTEKNGVHLIALGDWISQYSYAEMNAGKITLKTFIPDQSV